MDTDALLLPEPFSEKNIDGSPISKASEGGALFRNHARGERRVADRRSGNDRRTKESHPEYSDYEAPAYSAPVTGTYAGQGYEEKSEYDTERFDPPVDEKPGMIPNPMKMPPVKKKSSLEYDLSEADYGDYGGGSSAEPVQTEQSIQDDFDDGYGYSDNTDADIPATEAIAGDEYGYDYDDDSSANLAPAETAGTDDEYGYGYDNGREEAADNEPGYVYGYDDDNDSDARTRDSVVNDDFGYGFGDGDDIGADSGLSDSDQEADDDFDSGYGSSGGFDSDYDSDYGSGSDMSDDYY
ncbi:MAG: hypothetical protein IJ075_05365 [Lachnospiraceae bacterium]|nr:hypothetical protein [Lachnospiraceae bacterium]